MYVKDLEGREYSLMSTTRQEYELNGNQSLSTLIESNKVNDLFIKDISQMWSVFDFDEVEHKIVYLKRVGKGSKMTVDIKAIPLFFHEFNKGRIYEEYNEHMTADVAFRRIFDGTNFTYLLHDSAKAVEWEGFGGGETRLKTFQRALNRYKLEFEIKGNVIHLKRLIGRDTQFQYRYRLNASNIAQEIDANEMYTYARGYGDYGDGDGGEDWQDAKLKREYTSPLAKIPGIGKLHAPPIKNGKITDVKTMDEQLKTLVDESLKVSVSADLHDLRKQNYPLAQPKKGDRVFLIDERIEFDQEIRISFLAIVRDWKGNVLDLDANFGDANITKRHQANINTAIDNINEVVSGNKKLPYSVLDDAVQRATEALKSVQTELDIPENGGLLAVDKNDPNKLVLFNSAGLGISDDGGGTFKNSITGDGVVAETLIGRIIAGQNLRIENENSTFLVDGNGVTLDGGALHIKSGLPDNEIESSLKWNEVTDDVNQNRSAWDRASFINADGTFNTDALKGRLTDEQIASAQRWNGQGTYIGDDGVYTGLVIAEQIESGVINTDKIKIQGRTGNNHLEIVGAELKSNGLHERTWHGDTSTDSITIGFRDGQLRARNHDKSWSLFFNDWGISTFADGDGSNYPGGNASGAIEFHSYRYSGGRFRGLTIMSHGRTAIESSNPNGARIYLNPNGANVHVANERDYYYHISAAGFAQSSSRKLKRDIKPLQDNALDLINSLNIKEYKRLTDEVGTITDKWQVGIIVEEAPSQLLGDSESIDIYTYVNYLAKSIQELSQEINTLKGAA